MGFPKTIIPSIVIGLALVSIATLHKMVFYWVTEDPVLIFATGVILLAYGFARLIYIGQTTAGVRRGK